MSGAESVLRVAHNNVSEALCAGVHPSRTLAVVLDCGTDVCSRLRLMFGHLLFTNAIKQNEDLLKDELYLGLRQPRIRGEKYNDFVDTFVQSARKLYPHAYIHLYA